MWCRPPLHAPAESLPTCNARICSAQRIGTVDDIANAVLFAMTNTFMTGVTLKIDGGEPLS